ncbi:DUF742 domain-containing protein [Nocardia aurea]|uniref:DUF742 domain-containing protein n=1 Tax=Nocardia aurea TaxID=2144174 RepID=UPI000D688F7C|nr:DUF742 domain-containing protein [Nocardia aurea]
MNYYEDQFYEPHPEDDPGPLVRPFAVTRGRAGIDLYDLDILTLVVAVGSAVEVTTLDREYGMILRMCQERPLSIVEISAHLNLLVATVKVLVSDLITAGYVIFRSPTPTELRPDTLLIQAVLDGVRRL